LLEAPSEDIVGYSRVLIEGYVPKNNALACILQCLCFLIIHASL
jgi:hypothetical protein